MTKTVYEILKELGLSKDEILISKKKYDCKDCWNYFVHPEASLCGPNTSCLAYNIGSSNGFSDNYNGDCKNYSYRPIFTRISYFFLVIILAVCICFLGIFVCSAFN